MIPKRSFLLLAVLGLTVAVSDAWWLSRSKPRRNRPRVVPPKPKSTICESCETTPCIGATCEAFSEAGATPACRNKCDQCEAEFFFKTDRKQRTVNCDMSVCAGDCSKKRCRNKRYSCSSNKDCRAGLTCCKSCCGTSCKKTSKPGPDFASRGNCPQSQHYPDNCPAFDSAKHCHTDGDCTPRIQKCCSNRSGCSTCKTATLLGMEPWTPDFIPTLPPWIPQKP